MAWEASISWSSLHECNSIIIFCASDDNKAKITALGTINTNTDDAVLKEREAFEGEIDIAEREM